MSSFITALGLLAGAIAVSSSLPQLLKIIRSKKTRDISMATYLMLNLATFLWVIYGVVTSQVAVVIPNFIFFIFNSVILYLKIKHG